MPETVTSFLVDADLTFFYCSPLRTRVCTCQDHQLSFIVTLKPLNYWPCFLWNSSLSEEMAVDAVRASTMYAKLMVPNAKIAFGISLTIVEGVVKLKKEGTGAPRGIDAKLVERIRNTILVW